MRNVQASSLDRVSGADDVGICQRDSAPVLKSRHCHDAPGERVVGCQDTTLGQAAF